MGQRKLVLGSSDEPLPSIYGTTQTSQLLDLAFGRCDTLALSGGYTIASPLLDRSSLDPLGKRLRSAGNLGAIDLMASHRGGQSARCSRTIRTARLRSSGVIAGLHSRFTFSRVRASTKPPSIRHNPLDLLSKALNLAFGTAVRASPLSLVASGFSWGE